ncbi:MAG: lysophospholipid acyltransferase family protein [Elusimicrobiales bacterium]|nr:lysophospholipid acyltransferase family protein [Elusimicrobiales bacterium]
MSTPRWLQPLLHSLVPVLAKGYLSITGAATRVTWKLNEGAQRLENDNSNFIYAIWHSRQMFLMYTHRNRRACALVSLSRDGEYIARLLPKFGTRVVRGSTSKGGPQALLALLDMAREGWHPVITPDGPRGPACATQQGVIFLAQKTGLPIVPVACGLSRKIVFNSWDKFQFPLPFGKAAVVYGNPVFISAAEDPVQAALKVQRELDAATAEADALACS